MKKLSLDLKDLKVESFETAPKESQKGTVNGNAPTWHGDPTCETKCDPGTCMESCNGTCWLTCPDTCEDTCAGTCWETCLGWTCKVTPVFPCEPD